MKDNKEETRKRVSSFFGVRLIKGDKAENGVRLACLLIEREKRHYSLRVSRAL